MVPLEYRDPGRKYEIVKLVKEKHFHGLCLYKYKNINDNTDLESLENKFYILHDKHDLDKLLSDEK